MTSIWIMSDLHADASPWVPPPGPRVDVAIVAGDVADGLYAALDPLARRARRPEGRRRRLRAGQP